MDYRCSSSVAGLALLIGGSCALLTPSVQAGDPIEFSAPLVPLGIPQPEVVVRESQAPLDVSSLRGPNPEGDLPMPEMFASPQPAVLAKDHWADDPFRNDDPFNFDNQDQLGSDGHISAWVGSNRLTNGMALMMRSLQNDPDTKSDQGLFLRRDDSDLENSRQESRFDARNFSGRLDRQETDRFDSDLSKQKNDPYLFHSFARDPAAPDHYFNNWGFGSQMDESTSLTGEEPTVRKATSLLPVDAAHDGSLPEGFQSGDVPDVRQADLQSGAVPGYVRSWDTPAARPLQRKESSTPYQAGSSKSVAPNRSITLPIPKRPGDVNPFD